MTVAMLGTMITAAAGATVLADTSSETFDLFTVGSPNGQSGWSATGAFDHKIVTNTYGITSFGAQSLRISNAVTSGSFGDQTFSQSLTDAAGETTADPGTFSGGTRQPYFEAEWDFASTVATYQPGLAVTASPDRGDGARMSWIQLADTPTGIAVNFFDYRDEHPVGGAITGPNDPLGCGAEDDFFYTEIVGGLSRAVPHTIKVTTDFLEGPRNDVVRVWVDGVLEHVDTSWEDYFRYCEGNPTRTVDSILFRTGGTAAPDTLGNGFLIDNLSLMSGPTVTADADGAWTLSPAQTSSSATSTTTTTAYQSKVRAPINADGTSNFPKRRGVIPVQFDLESATRTVVSTTTTTGPVIFESIGSDADITNDFSFLRFVPDAPLSFADLNELVANYTFTQGDCAGGSLRWQVRLDVGNDGSTANDGNIMVYFGTSPNFTDCTLTESNTGQNLIGSSDARFDLSQVGGPIYGTYADALALRGNTTVLRASLILDSGWAGDQKVTLTGASFDGNDWTPLATGITTTVTSDTTTAYAKTCDLPQAALKWAKNDATPTGAINEAEAIQPKDSGVYYRTVDCKYIYNLDVSSLGALATRDGTYYVYVNIGGENLANPAVFDLR